MSKKELNKKIRIATNELIKKAEKLLERLSTLMPQKEINIASLFLLFKNIFTYKTIRSLCNRGEAEEAIVLMRFFLERIALAFKISKDKIDFKDLKKIKASKSILELKKAFSYSGIWYGLLSKVTHGDWWLFFNTHITINKKKPILTFSPHIKDNPIYRLFLYVLVELNLATVEFIAKDSIDEIFSWSLKKEKWIYSTNPQVLKNAKKWYLKSKKYQ